MIIALTQRELDIRGWKYDCTSQDWFSFLNRHTMRFVPNVKDFDYAGVDCLLLTGGESTPNRDRVEEFAINLFLEENKPIIGVCHGAFFLNHYFGGANGKIKGHRGINHKIKMEGATPYVASYHSTSIKTLADELEPIAWDMQGNVEGFKHKDKQIWGLVWHPERMVKPVLPSDLEEFLND